MRNVKKIFKTRVKKPVKAFLLSSTLLWFPIFCGAAGSGIGLLDGHLKALGGESAVRNIRTAHYVWDVQISIIQGTVAEWYAAPDKKRIEIRTPVVSQTEGENGRIAWTLDQNSQVIAREITSEPPRENVLPIYRYLFPGGPVRVSDAGEHNRDGILYRVLEVEQGDDPVSRLYLDPDTFLVSFEESEEDGIAVVTHYGDYREIGGIMIAHAYSQQADIRGMPMSLFALKQVDLNPEIEPSRFDPPGESLKDCMFPEGRDRVSVPLEVEGEHLFVNVEINGTGPCRFLLDSGAGTTIISRDLAKKLGLDVREGMQALGVGGVKNIGAALIDLLGIGGFGIQGLKLYAADLGFMKDAFSRQVDGVLGYDLFVRTVLRLDSRGRTLEIIDPSSFEYEGSGEIVAGEIKSNLIHVPGILDDEFEGLFRVDTGAAGGIHLHGPFVREHGLMDRYKPLYEISTAGVAGSMKGFAGRAERFRIGDLELPLPLISLSQGAEAGALDMVDSIGTIGNAVWRKFTVIFDYRRNRMILEPNNDFSKPMGFNKTGCYVAETEGRKWITRVLPDTPAHQVGLEKGDVLLKINKLDAADINLSDIDRIFNGPEGQRLKLRINRDGKSLRKTLILEEYL